jgi:uncharacterized protein (DUF342 family)
MSLLKNHTQKTEMEFKKLLAERYDLAPSDYSITRIDGIMAAKIMCEEDVDSMLEIDVTTDGLKAYISLYPPVNKGEAYSIEQVLKAVEENQITVNLKMEVLRNAFEMYADNGIIERVLFAEGVEPISGSDAQITLNFEPVKKMPKLLDSGRVDYKNIDNIRLTRKGDILLIKKPLTSGVKGLTVRNEEIPSEKGKDIKITVDDGATTDEHEKEFYAAVDGCVIFRNNRIGVSPVYSVTNNVDYSTGNIVFNGVVHVRGDILSGFSVKAEKDVMVEGIVQDATIESGGNIVIKTGLKGDFKNNITAAGDITIGYAEKANLAARGNVEILKYAFNSQIKAGGMVIATGDPGIIAGGKITGFSEIKLNQAGTKGNSSFLMSVGTKYFFEEELKQLQDNKDKYIENLEKIDEFLSKLDTTNKEILKNQKVKQLLVLRKQVMDNLNKCEELIKKLIKSAHYTRPKIKITGTMFEGLDVQIFREKLTMREKMQQVVLFYDEKFERIAWVTLEDKESQYD